MDTNGHNVDEAACVVVATMLLTVEVDHLLVLVKTN